MKNRFYQEGEEASRRYIKDESFPGRQACPYPIGSIARRCWIIGWNNGLLKFIEDGIRASQR